MRSPLDGEHVEGGAKPRRGVFVPGGALRRLALEVACEERGVLAMARLAEGREAMLLVHLADDGAEVAPPVSNVVAVHLRLEGTLRIAGAADFRDHRRVS